MAPTFRYSHPTTPAGTGFDTDLGSVVPWGSISGLVTMASAGEVGVSTIYIDDPEGTLDIKGLHRFRMVESEASTDPVWNGYINDQRIGRIGASELFMGTAGRSWELSLSDDNAILSFRVVSGSDGNRPAESGSARLAWLISTNYLGDVVDDGFVTYPAGTAALDATDYRGQFGKDVLGDLALQCGGVNYFCQYDLSTSGTSQDIGLWFGDSNTSTAFSSSIIIDNFPEAADGTAIFAPSDNTVLVRDPSRIAAGVYLPYNGGSIYAYDYATSYAFAFRDQVAPTATISSQTQATALTDQFLADFDTQDERITTTIWMKPANLYDVRAGHRVRCRFTHLPGYDAQKWMRVTQKTIGNFNTSTGLYEVGLELSPQTTCEGNTDHGLNSEGATWTSSFYTGPLGTGLTDVIASDQRWWGSETGYGSPSDLGDGSASTWCGYPDTLVYQNTGPHIVSLHCDLGSAKTVSQLQIHELEHDTGGFQFTLWSSDDDTNWTERYGPFGPVNNGTENYYNLAEAVTARYWRITGAASVGDTRVGPWEPLYDIRWYRVSLWGCVQT